MALYYDHKCIDCDKCLFRKFGNFPNGDDYECCKFFGYMFNPKKGVSPEHCEHLQTDPKKETNPIKTGARSIREMGKSKNK